jgi:hypothetical protein
VVLPGCGHGSGSRAESDARAVTAVPVVVIKPSAVTGTPRRPRVARPSERIDASIPSLGREIRLPSSAAGEGAKVADVRFQRSRAPVAAMVRCFSRAPTSAL